MSTIILHRFVNREYRLTHQDIFARKPEGGDKYKEVKAEKYAQAVADTYVLQQELVQGEAVLISGGKLERRSFGETDARLGTLALDIIDEFRQITKGSKKGGWGELSRPTSFTKNARHRLLEAGAIVDSDCGKDAWEITLTFPGSMREGFECLASHTGWIIDRLFREVRRAGCQYWFYVWEWQKRGALHLHVLIGGLGTKTRSLAHSLEYNWWELLWELSDLVKLDLFRKSPKKTWRYRSDKWQSHTAPIYRSVAAYFSKYAGKQQSKSAKGFTREWIHCPSRWWGCSYHLKARIKQTRRKYSINTSKSTAKKIQEYLQNWLFDPARIKQYSYEFQLGKTANGTELGGGETWINYYNDEGFARMQGWEQIMWEGALAIAHEAGEYDYPKENWDNLDHACEPPLYVAMNEYKKRQESSGITDTDLPSPPLNQPSSTASKLRNARRTQAEPCLALRALAVRFLSGGGEETMLITPDDNLQLNIPGLTTC